MAVNLDTEPQAHPSDTDPASLLIEGYLERRHAITTTIRDTRILAVVVVALSILVAYSLPDGGSRVFITAIILFVLQIFDTASYRSLIRIDRAIGSVNVGIVEDRSTASWLSAAASAVYYGYFVIFICFDSTWMFYSYINPVPAVDFAEYLQRLQFGLINGMGFINFTIVFWIVYTTLFIIGTYRSTSIEQVPSIHIPRVDGGPTGPQRGAFSVDVASPNGKGVRLQGFRMPNPAGRPLILWPGFYQNGYVWDLMPEKGISVAEYLWRAGYDCWIIHSRGTDTSGGRWKNASLDDYASLDIPAVIEYVLNHTGQKPMYVGHSQGGMTAMMSLMGAYQGRDGRISLSDESAATRQDSLHGLVTLGSFLDFTFSRPSALKDFALNGLRINVFGMKIKLITGSQILFLLRVVTYYPVPIGRMLRRAILTYPVLRVVLFPMTWLLNFVAGMSLWEFLYHIPNVSNKSRRYMFNRTIDATFHGILREFYGAVRNSAMNSLDGRVNYSANYHRLRLPVSFVTMEFDPLADPVRAREFMFPAAGSAKKFFTEWKGLGHEDHFMNPEYFPLVLEAIRKIDNE